MQKIKKIYRLGILPYALFLFYLMIFGFGRERFADHLFRIIPIRSSYQLFTEASSWQDYQVYFRNFFGNILLFIPFGFLSWALPKRNNLKQILLLFIPAIFFVECIQYISKLGVFDIDDILLNSFGVCLGYLIKDRFLY